MGRTRQPGIEGIVNLYFPVRVLRQLRQGSLIANKTQTWLVMECLRRSLFEILDEFRAEQGRTTPIDRECGNVLEKEYNEWVQDRDAESEERLRHGICSRRTRQTRERLIEKLARPLKDGENTYGKN